MLIFRKYIYEKDYMLDDELGESFMRKLRRYDNNIFCSVVYRNEMFVIDDEQKGVIAFGVIRRKISRETWSREHWLYDIYVKPTERGRGYGRLLMENLMNYARQCKIKRLYLWVDKNNIVAQTLYLHRGFTIKKSLIINI